MATDPLEVRRIVEGYYASHGRHDLPWRLTAANGALDPYAILVSEIMLQQTQVPRVIPKFTAFMAHLPTVAALAAAPLKDVLIAWQGLGYNRRAKYLWEAAVVIDGTRGGVFPRSVTELARLPGVGKNTAGAIMAYAYNEPVVFIETNIRTVFIYHCFRRQDSVSDAAIMKVLEQALDHRNPREFYWGLMDYGTYLKQTVGNLSQASKGYAKQTKFHGSLRQVRGKILRLLAHRPLREHELLRELADDRAEAVLASLVREGLIRRAGARYDLPQ